MSEQHLSVRLFVAPLRMTNAFRGSKTVRRLRRQPRWLGWLWAKLPGGPTYLALDQAIIASAHIVSISAHNCQPRGRKLRRDCCYELLL